MLLPREVQRHRVVVAPGLGVLEDLPASNGCKRRAAKSLPAAGSGGTSWRHRRATTSPGRR